MNVCKSEASWRSFSLLASSVLCVMLSWCSRLMCEQSESSRSSDCANESSPTCDDDDDESDDEEVDVDVDVDVEFEARLRR